MTRPESRAEAHRPDVKGLQTPLAAHKGACGLKGLSSTVGLRRKTMTETAMLARHDLPVMGQGGAPEMIALQTQLL